MSAHRAYGHERGEQRARDCRGHNPSLTSHASSPPPLIARSAGTRSVKHIVRGVVVAAHRKELPKMLARRRGPLPSQDWEILPMCPPMLPRTLPPERHADRDVPGTDW
jgi:hypothetical protein